MIPPLLSRIHTEPFALMRCRFDEFLPRLDAAEKNPSQYTLPAGVAWSAEKIGPCLGGTPLIPQIEIIGPLAVVQVAGVLALGVTIEDCYFLGGYDYDWLIQFCEQAAATPGVRKILVQWNSPGGSFIGLEECAAALAAIAARGFEIVHYARQCVASAAYRLTLGGALVVSQSCIVGSIGGISKCLDTSKAAAMAGFEQRVFTSDGLGNSSPLKAAGTPLTLISEDVAAFIQARTHEATAKFRAAVTAARPTARGPALLGGWDYGEAAVANGLADQVCDSIEPLVCALAS